jgi:hypothetical protein
MMHDQGHGEGTVFSVMRTFPMSNVYLRYRLGAGRNDVVATRWVAATGLINDENLALPMHWKRGGYESSAPPRQPPGVTPLPRRHSGIAAAAMGFDVSFQAAEKSL